MGRHLIRVTRRSAAICPLPAVIVLLWTGLAYAQGVDLSNRPVAEVRIEGLSQVPEQLARNQIRIRVGDPYDSETVQRDIERLTHLGRFGKIVTKAEPLVDGSIVLTYAVTELPLIADILFTGNKQIADQELAKLVLLRTGDAVDAFLIENAIRQIKGIYEKQGYFATDVTIDQTRLDEEGILLFQIREGPRPRIRAINFEGNKQFTAQQLQSKIRSKTYVFMFRKGQLSREQLKFDAAELRKFYQDRGFLDARVDEDPQISPDEKEAVVTFLIDEGRRYTVNSIRVAGNQIFTDDQIAARMPLRVGDIYSANLVARSREALEDMYGKLGYIEANIRIEPPLFRENLPEVDVEVSVVESIPYTVGVITVQGNQLTKDKVILRQLRGMRPGRPFDRTGIKQTQAGLAPSSLFDQARVTVLGTRQDEVRDVLVEVREKNTGSLSFGAGVSSDAGVAGAIDLVQRNFDIADYPESFGEFMTGKAFRGAGQFFSIAAQPGNERSLYSLNFKEPYILDSDYFLDTKLFFFDREREDWDAQRMGGKVAIGQRFGDVYSADVRLRAEEVEISRIDPAAPADVFAVDGQNVVTSVGFTIARNTTDNRIFPTTGSRITASIERAGTMGGDFDFTKATATFRKFWTVEEDFFKRKTVLSLRGQISYIFEEDEAPLFERFHAGGHSTFRGFGFRGVGPRGVTPTGVQTDDPVGGDFLLLAGVEYNVPIFQEVLRGVVFVDSGTVQKDFALNQYRVSIGTGIRLRVPFLGSAPFAFDIAVPLAEQGEDETQVFSFDIDIPF